MHLELVNQELYDIVDFEVFKRKNKLLYNEKKKKWNKEFRPKIKTIWVTDRKNWNKDLRKYGYYQNIQYGYELGPVSAKKCNYCGKFLVDKQTKFCDNPNHKKLFHKYLKMAYKKFGFTLEKGVMKIPSLYNLNINDKGDFFQTEIEGRRIQAKDITFTMDGKSYRLTTKSRTI